ncbi:MAG: hypothetical protein GXP26_14675 [Planctomycetes bacterium]|nr:hypothetical protein [Planctomycetota bacterium]
MPQDVSKQIDALRRRLQTRHIFIATCWLVAAVLASALLLASLDWLLNIGDVTGRIVCTLALVCLALLAGRRWLAEVWQRRFTSVSVAQRIERRHPELRDIVTSALYFNQQSPSDLSAGSESLRRAVVLRAGTSVGGIKWRQLVSPQTFRQAMAIATTTLLFVAGMMWQTPLMVNTAVTRLLNPFSSVEWPRENDLQFANPPSILAAGDDLVLELRDTRGSLPTSIVLHSRTKHNGRWVAETQKFATAENSQELRLTNIQESLEFRVTGGDHTTMRWHPLKVVAPPRVQTVQVTVRPPEYTRLPARRFEAGESLLAGSRLQVEGKIDRKATSVVLRGENGLTIPTVLDDGGLTFRTPPDDWRIESSRVVSFEITTAEGLKFRSRRQLTLEVLPDQSPRVAFVEPTGKLSVSPTAIVPVVVTAQDDLAVRDVQLVYRRTDRLQKNNQRLTIYKGPEIAMSPPAGRQQRAEHRWHLETLGLKVGAVLEVHAQASDYRPATGKTDTPLRLQIVSVEELLHEIANQETDIIEILQRLQQQQKELRTRTANWETQENWDGQRRKKAISHLLSKQRQLVDALANDRGGVIQQIEAILADFDRNALHRPESKQRLKSLHQLLSTLAQEPLPAIEQLLGDWLRYVQSPRDQAETKQQQSETIATVVQQQDNAIEALQQAIDLMTMENTLAQFENEVASLQMAQQQLADRSQEAILSTAAGKNSEQRQAATKQQRQLSRELAKLVMRMSRSAKQQSAIAGQLSDAVSLARERGVQATMRTASDNLGNQQFGQALSLQQRTIENLQEMRGRLAGKQSGDKRQNAMNTQGNEKGEEGSQAGTQQQPDGNVAAGTNPKESVDPSGSKPATPATDKIAEDLVQDLWGHLPERQREQILQPLREEFLPKYAPEIEAYFRALAEPEEGR